MLLRVSFVLFLHFSSFFFIGDIKICASYREYLGEEEGMVRE
jgi:hypothetical protein